MISIPWPLLMLLVAVACVFACLWGISKSSEKALTNGLKKTENDLETADAKLKEAQVELKDTNAKLVAAEKKVSHFEGSGDVKETMRNAFKELSRNVLDKQREDTADKAEKELQSVIRPMQQQVTEFRERLELLHDISEKNQGKLDQQFIQMGTHVNKLSGEADKLVNALKGNVQVRGAWGETILKKALEDSGLTSEQIELYVPQMQSEVDGKKVRPDFVVKLPGSRALIIDSKVATEDFLEYQGHPEGSPESDKAVAQLKAAMTKQVNEINKKYASLPDLNTPGIAIMFTPLEPALRLAVYRFPELFTHARSKNVIIAGPTMLMDILRIVHQLWQAHNSSKNLKEIMDCADKIASNVTYVLESVDKIENGTKMINETANDLKTKFNGRQGITYQADKMKSYGCTPKKDTPPKHLAAAIKNNPSGESGTPQ